jgi:succinate dehydrogenase/fumarate reductase flavoprotein subunit
MNPGAISLYSDHGIDITREPLRVAVCAQHNNGGIRIDSDWQTSVKGLYAAGEAAGSLGIFRPGGTALNSCQVGSLRAAEHIVWKSDNLPSESFDSIALAAVAEADAIIAATRGEKSTVIAMRDKYSARMSQHFAFLRDIPSMERALLDISADKASFSEDNKWKNVWDIPHLFKNLDIIRMEEAIAAAISYTAKTFGSRGSGFVLSGGDFMDRLPVAEDASGRERIVTVTKREGKLEIDSVPVRPIPTQRDLWFEKVWGKYRELTEKK